MIAALAIVEELNVNAMAGARQVNTAPLHGSRQIEKIRRTKFNRISKVTVRLAGVPSQSD